VLLLARVRRCTIRSDGRRQIVDLMLPQDFFFVSDSKRDGTIEAVVEETVLASYSGARVEQLAERDPLFARELREVAFQSLTRSQDQLQILGGITALEKVGSFMLSLDGRGSEKRGQVELPVSRYDIADYLAVSVETVCRSITDLQHRGVIALAGKRTVKILKPGRPGRPFRRTRNGGVSRLSRERTSVAAYRLSSAGETFSLASTPTRIASASCRTPSRSIIRARWTSTVRTLIPRW